MAPGNTNIATTRMLPTASNEATTTKEGFEGQIVKTNDQAKKVRQWQACLGTKSDRLVPGNVSELKPEARQPKDKAYQHQPLQQPSHLWADTVTAGDKDVTKGRRYQSKLN